MDEEQPWGGGHRVFFSSRRRHTRYWRDWSSDVCSSDLGVLENELASTKEYVQSLLAEHARSNDDLASANEEFVSNNEELQSMNEELETAKEELQSTNEELTTVNEELNGRNQELGQVNADLVNLLDTVDIP